MGEFSVMKDRPDWGDVYQAGKNRVRQLFEEFDTHVVMFSGGKDSGLVLNLCLEVIDELGNEYDQPLQVVHIDDEFMHPETEQYVESFVGDERLKLWWCCLPVKYRNGCIADDENGWWYPWHPEKESQWIRDLPTVPDDASDAHAERVMLSHSRMADFTIGSTEHKDLPRFLFPFEEFGAVAQITGLRVAESMTRYQAVMRREDWRGYPQDCEEDGPQQCHPVYDWDDEELWHAFDSLAWEYNPVYDAFARLGHSAKEMRTAHPYGEESIGHGMYESLQKNWPDLFEKAKHRVPGAKLAFEVGTQIQAATKGNCDTWKERTAQLLHRIEDDELRSKQRQRVEKNLQYHYQHSTTPPHETRACPYCNVNWRGLARALQRGDLTGRHGLN